MSNYCLLFTIIKFDDLLLLYVLPFLHDVDLVALFSGPLQSVMGCREQPPRGAPWVSGLVGHFVQTLPDSECSHKVQFLDSTVLRL